MLFHSYAFLFVFLPVALVGFAIAARLGRSAALGWLVACSLVFYAAWHAPYLLLLLGSVGFNFAVGRALAAGSGGRLLLSAGVAANLGLLGWFKYANFFAHTANAALDAGFQLAPIALPLAISFFTFQQIAYLVDAYRGQTERAGFMRYALFVTFFPQLIAGPIVHHREMLPQFRERALRLDPRDVSVGVTFFTIGLCKKVLIADNLAPLADPVYASAALGATPAVLDAWLGTLAYAFQIYFDFSGYSDMAIGLARIVGFRLPLNFDSPYKAASAIEFWRRWHMTLSRFLRNYLYIPLGGNRRGRTRRYANLMLTMLLGGLWHGAGWNFVLWGGLHGAFLVANHGWRALRGGRPAPAGYRRVGARLLTFAAVLLAWVFFRAATFDAALRVLAGMFGIGDALPRALDASFALPLLTALLAWVWLAPNTQEFLRDFEPALGWPRGSAGTQPRVAWRPSRAWAVLVAILFAVSIPFLDRAAAFVYWQF